MKITFIHILYIILDTKGEVRIIIKISYILFQKLDKNL